MSSYDSSFFFGPRIDDLTPTASATEFTPQTSTRKRSQSSKTQKINAAAQSRIPTVQANAEQPVYPPAEFHFPDDARHFTVLLLKDQKNTFPH